ncbi:MAG: hypothetical protein AB7N76_11750 [Planctomycetota bacterium]
MNPHVWTAALQALNFVVLAWLLQRVLYRPVLEILERRKTEAREARERARAAADEAEATRRALEEERGQLARARDEAAAAMRREVEGECEAVKGEARAAAASLLATAREHLEDERRRALASLREEVSGLAVDLSRRLLGALATPGLAEAALERLDAHLAGLPAEEREELLRGLAGELRVVVAPALDADAQARWGARLGARLGGARVAFASDAALLAGAELWLPDSRLRFSLESALERAREELVHDGPAG